MSEISDEAAARDEPSFALATTPPPSTTIEESHALPPLTQPARMLRLDPAYVTVERIVGWIVALVVILIGLGALVLVWFNVGIIHWAFISSAFTFIMLASGLVWLTHCFPKLQHERAGWRLTHCGLEIHRGVWWRSEISVPLARVQHTDVHQGPLLRRFGLAKLIVHTAGTENSAVELAGLSFANAQRLRDALIEGRGVIDGV